MLITPFVVGFLIVIIFIALTTKRKHDTGKVIKEIRRRLVAIDPTFEDVPIIESDKSFARNKRTVYLCVRNPRTGRLYDIDVLMFVAIHEMAHIVTTRFEVDHHGPVFEENFNTLLMIAAQKGVYDPSVPIPPSYCAK